MYNKITNDSYGECNINLTIYTNEIKETTITDAANPINLIMSNNLEFLMNKMGFSQTQLSKMFEIRGIKLPQGTIYKYLKEPDKNRMPISAIVNFCAIFEIAVEDFMDPNLKNYYRDSETRKASPKSYSTSSLNEDLLFEFFSHIFKQNSSYEFNFEKGHFDSIARKYFLYFYPTNSIEQTPLCGELRFFEKNNVCHAEFILDTQKTNERTNEALLKNYVGAVVLSKTAMCYSCFLMGKDVDEFAFLNFRYFKPTGKYLDCRVVEVLTTSAGEDHHPVIHRALLTRSAISEEDLDAALQYIKLGNSKMLVDKDELIRLKKEHNNYYDVIDKIESEYKKVRKILEVDEDQAILFAKNSGLNLADMYTFVSRLRKICVSDRYNKVSKKLDDNVRGFLLSREYFKST